MTYPPTGRLGCSAVFAALAILAASAVSAQQYVQATAEVSGKEIHNFTDDGQNVTVVLGEFSLTVGERRITGRDGVLWISTDTSAKLHQNNITVYSEGGVQVTEPDGQHLSDRTMVIVFRNAGKLTAEGLMSDRPLQNFPLYNRAKKARDNWLSNRKQAKPIVRHAAPKLISGDSAKAMPATKPATVAPPMKPSPRPGKQADAMAPKPTQSGKASEAADDKPTQPVNFHADRVTHQLDEAGNRWVTIAKGNVYLSQGDPDSDLFVEMRSQAAVVFSATGVEDRRDASSPMSAKPVKIEQAADLVITGAYLEQDVVISRGERYFRGEAAYYDFTTDRAIVTDPVFRTVQQQRDIPIYVRATEARMLSAREIWFADAKVSTSEFYTPTYDIRSSKAYLMDNTPYDADGKPLGERAWQSKLTNTIFSIRDIPVFWTPWVRGNLQQGNSPLRTASFGKSGKFGWGVETQWHLFRLLGLIKPEGFKGRLNLDWLERGVVTGVDLDYARRNFSGYSVIQGVVDDQEEDDFGQERQDLPAPGERGRVLMRHKQFLPADWQLQLELSYVCDRNFLEEYFPDEFFAGKEQETLAYAKKQRDNWAFTSLLQYRLNRWQSQAESLPDLGFYLIGEPLLGNTLTFFSESHAGIKKYKTDNALVRNLLTDDKIDSRLNEFETDHFVRLDSRNEVQLPLHVGPLNFVPYAVGRATWWGEKWPNQLDADRANFLGHQGREQCRPYGQIGLRSATHVWSVFDNVESRLWDLHRLKHIITPEAVAFLASSHGVYPEELFPMDAGVEEHLERTSGAAFNLYQRLQTKRGAGENRHTVDWMRLNLSLALYDNNHDEARSDGRFFWYRPENSIDRNHLNAEYFWQISDSTQVLADANYDIDDQQLGRGDVGIAVARDPRLRYYAGMRYTDDVDSAMGTFGVDYQISKKYTVSAFEQYDFSFDGGQNMSSSVTITRKLPRWYAAFTFSYDTTSDNDELTLMMSFWPEGIEEVKLGGGKMTLLGRSDKN